MGKNIILLDEYEYDYYSSNILLLASKENEYNKFLHVKEWTLDMCMFFAIAFTFIIYASFLYIYPQTFAYSTFGEWARFERRIERVNRVLDGAKDYASDLTAIMTTPSIDLRPILQSIVEKPRLQPLKQIEFIQQADQLFGKKLSNLIKQYEEVGNKIQEICGAEKRLVQNQTLKSRRDTATDLNAMPTNVSNAEIYPRGRHAVPKPQQSAEVEEPDVQFTRSGKQPKSYKSMYNALRKKVAAKKKDA